MTDAPMPRPNVHFTAEEYETREAAFCKLVTAAHLAVTQFEMLVEVGKYATNGGALQELRKALKAVEESEKT